MKFELNFITGASRPHGLAINNSYIYWVNNSSEKIGRAKISGEEVNQSFISTTGEPIGVAVDSTYIYWSRTGSGCIARAKLNGESIESEWIKGLTKPYNMVVDSEYIMWTTYPENLIGRAKLNGTSVEKEFIKGGNKVTGIALSSEFVYWTNYGNGTIGRANLNGEGINQEFVKGNSSYGPDGISVTSKYIYWTDFEKGFLSRSLLNGTEVRENYVEGLGESASLATSGEEYIYWCNAASSGTIGRIIMEIERKKLIELEYKKEEREVLGTVANIKYYHQAKEWNSPLSFGVQAFIEYNGLVLNDRHQADLIRVTKVVGLDDAEVRDNRELRASESGEFPYQAFYGGRNLVISGFIEAGNLGALGTLETNLKAAFAPLEESQLKFRWFDIYDPFDDPRTILEYNPNANLAGIPSGNYIALIGTLNNLQVENGLLSWKASGKVYAIRAAEKRTFCDVQMTIKCIPGPLKDNSFIGFILCAKDYENYLYTMYYNGENLSSNPEPVLKIISVVNGEEHVIALISVESFPKNGEYFWFRSRKEGNKIYAEYWENNPYKLANPINILEANLYGEDAELFGDEILSQVGIAGNQTNTNWSFDEFKIESLYPGDIEFQARKLSPISIPSEQTSLTKFKRPFQIAMKTSDFRAFSSTKITNFIYPSSSNSNPERGFRLPLTLPLKFNVLTSKELPLQSNLLSINNRGTVYVEPIIYLYGPGENILIENLTNSQSLEWLGFIPSGDYMIFECGKEKTVTNSLGTNFLEFLVPTTEWIRLEPKWNDLYISGSGFIEGKTKMEVKYRFGYM